jgi:hypothetical protein
MSIDHVTRHAATLALALSLAAVAAAAPARAQQQRRPAAAAPDTSLPTGTWRGTSTCLMGKPVCKDEIAVYHIAAAPSGADSVTIVANKVVAGVEEDMGTLQCRVERAAAQTVVCAMPPQYPPGEWRFERRGDTLEGGLTLADGRRMRAVRLTKS